MDRSWLRRAELRTGLFGLYHVTEFESDLSVGYGAAKPLAALHERLSKFSTRISVDTIDDALRGFRTFTRDQPTWSDRNNLGRIFVLERGWAYRFSVFPNGRRHISEFFGPGAICNWARLSEFVEQDNLLFKAGAEIAHLDVECLATALADSPVLESAFKRHEINRVMRASQRTRAIITLPSTEKILIVLLDLLDEGGAATDRQWLSLPFTFEELADIVGISPIHVSRVFKTLEESGEISRKGRKVRLNNRARAIASLDYRAFFSVGDAV